MRFFLPLSLFGAAAFGGCGDSLLPDAGDASGDASGDGPGTDALGSPDTAVADGNVPGPDAARDAVGDTATEGDTATDAPTRAPFGLDTRPANPTCVAPARPAPPGKAIRFTQVFEGAGLSSPMVIAQIPGDKTRFFAAERAGTVVSFAAVNPVEKRVVATMPEPVNTDYEGGLLGMAFHPRFATNGYAYFFFTGFGGGRPSNMRSKIVRMTSTDNGLTFGNAVTILGPVDKEDVNHCGGDLHFGPDGFLYASIGDGGDQTIAQSKTGFLAKILRLDVDSAFPYAIPDGNPFKSGGGEPATFAHGFRNPYRFSIDSASGQLWVGDVGQSGYEEVDRVVAGGNYGWNQREGAHCNPLVPFPCQTAGFIDPYWEYPHNLGSTVIGGPLYRGTKLTEHVGRLFVADFNYAFVKTLADDPTTGNVGEIELNPIFPQEPWIGFAEDDDHEVYGIELDSAVFALDEEPGQPTPPPFPATLSKTGCFDPADPKKPGAPLVPYGVNSPFWSDGADKDRYFAIPDGTKVTVAANGHFDFPIGSVLVKSFRIDGKLVETRLFVRHADGEGGGYSYEWNAAQTDATLLPANKTKALAGVKSWYFPGRGECLGCHTAAAGRSLGLEVGQLNGDFVYERTNRVSNQLATLDRVGIFNAPIGAPSTLLAYPDPNGTGPAEARARSYLHANCANCHRPGGPGRLAMDLRYSQPLAATGTCNANPVGGDLGVGGAKIVTPGRPEASLLALRMRATPASRMPPLATRLVDATGAGVVDGWIRGLATCPP